MKFVRDEQNKITRRVINDRAYIENMTLYVDGEVFGFIGGTFNMREAIRTSELFA